MADNKNGKAVILRNLARKNKVDAMSKFGKIKRAIKHPRPRQIK